MRFRPFADVVVIAVLSGFGLAGCNSDDSPAQSVSSSGASSSVEFAVPTTWAEVDDALGGLPGFSSLIAAEVAPDSSSTTVHDRTPNAIAAIGSASTLYVLGIVTDRVAGGDLGWDDPLTITDGSTISVSGAALLMMAESDQTATDLLIAAVGRDQVEGLAPSMGLGEDSQARTLPWLTTREHSILTSEANSRIADRYAAGDINVRRQVLADLSDEVLPDDALPDDAGAQPVMELDTIGWFASAAELGKAQVWIDSQRGLPGQEPLEQILTAEPGATLDPAVWTKFSYAGEVRPDIASVSWLLQRADGRRFVVAIVANDSQRQIDPAVVGAIAEGVIKILAAT